MIKIYGNERCVWCIKAKNMVKNYNIKYEWLNTDESEVIAELKNLLPEAKKIPQIWWYDRYIGGYDELASEIENTVGGYGEGKI